MTHIYETNSPKVDAQMPRQLRGKTAQEIVTYLQSHFQVDFTIDENGCKQTPRNKATAYMMAVSKAIFDPSDWKAPIKTWFPSCGDEWTKAAIIWYHGAEPRSNNGYWVYSPGYAC